MLNEVLIMISADIKCNVKQQDFGWYFNQRDMIGYCHENQLVIGPVIN